MVRWETRYAKSDGVSIAYQVVGEGPTDLILVPGFASHVEVAWEEPRLAHFLGRLAAFSRLIVFDKRGTGMSDPVDSVPSSRRSAGRPGGRSDCETAKQGLATRRSVADSVVRHCLSPCGDLAPGPLLRAGECDVQSETAGDRCR